MVDIALIMSNLKMKPKIIFLFVLLIESSLSIMEKSSLTFVIDDTGSMGDDIDQVKHGANLVFETVLSSNGSQIDNFIIVTFNDPGFKLRIVTKDQKQYKRELEAIYVDGGGDCAEMSMSGIELALKESLPGSYLYVFTDASAKDFNLSERVQNLAIKKQTQIVFLLTGRCTDDDNDPQYQAYYHLADATSGQVFHMYKQDVGKILQYIAETVSSRKSVVTRKKFPPGYGHNVTIPVDAGMKDVVISESGHEPRINVTAPDGSKTVLEHLVDTSDVVAVKIPVVMPGNYTAELGSKSETNVVVTAATSINFKHGFSTVLPTSIKGTATRPIENKETFLAIELVTKEPGVTLNSVEILDVDENLVAELPLKLYNKKQKLYVTRKLLPPDYLFKLAVKGYDVKSKSSFRRITPTAIEPQKPDLELPDGKKPLVEIENGLKVNANYGEPLKIACNVNAYPKPDIIWLGNNGTMLSSSVTTVEIPYDHINILEIKNVTSNSSYTCKSANEYGEDSQIVEVKSVQIKEAPKIDKTKNVFYFARGEPGEINCRVIKGNPKPKIVWYFLPSGAQLFVKMNETEERISWDNVEDAQAGIYRCEAINEVGYDNFKLYLVVDYPPTIQPGLTLVKSIEGKTTKLTCNVQGFPKPRVDWYLNGVKIISDRKHHIYRDNSLWFQGSVQNQGQFTCVATNSLGSANRTVNVNYIAPVTMDPPEQSTFETKVEGNLQLPCSADGYPQPMIKWLFFSSEKDTTPKKLWARAASGFLNLSHLQLNQDGYYTCVASNGYTSANLTYQVKILASPDIETPPQSFTAVVGDLVLRLPCAATGKPKPEITWTKNGFNIAAGSEWYDIQPDGTLIIKSVDTETGGAYVCIATNSLGNDHEMFNVIITSQPEKIPDTTIIVEEGKSKKIECATPHKIVDSLRWFKDGKLIATGELTLRNVKLTDRGIYTCRVSTFHSSESSSTKLVVGTKPIFYVNPEQVINFEEDMPAFLNCEALGEPAPKVMWSHEGFILDYTDMVYDTLMTFDKRGKYTCIVENLFGSINRTFEISSKECVLNIKQDFTTHQPLMVDDSFRLPLFDNNNVFMRILNEETVVLHCPSGFANIPKKTVMATCVREKNFRIGRDIYEFSQLTCQEEVKPKVVKTGNRCTPTESEIVKVGYEINDRFIEVFEVCLDKDKNAPVYAKQRVHRSLVDTEPDLVWSWQNDDSLPLEFDEIYDCGIQIERISSFLGRWFHPDDKCCFKKRQLVNPRDLLGSLPQKATYSYLNVVPQWSSCNSKNWDELEKRVRLLAKSSYDDLLVWTGTSGNLELPNSEGSPEVVQLIDSQYLHQSIPRYLWKVVQNPDTRSSLAIVQLNIPDLTPVEAYRHMTCRDICRDVTWMVGHRWREPKDGYTFCCSLEEFEQAFGYKGRFGSENRNILKGVSYLPLHSLG